MLMFEKFGKSSPGAELLHIPFPSLNLGLCSTACCCEFYNPCFWPLPIQQQLGFHPVSAVFGPFLALDAVDLQQVLLRFISFWNLLLSLLFVDPVRGDLNEALTLPGFSMTLLLAFPYSLESRSST